jgi:hypothetical protein
MAYNLEFTKASWVGFKETEREENLIIHNPAATYNLKLPVLHKADEILLLCLLSIPPPSLQVGHFLPDKFAARILPHTSGIHGV